MSTLCPLAAVVCRVPRRAPGAGERLRLRALAARLPNTPSGRLAGAMIAERLATAPPASRYARPVYGPGPVPSVPVVFAVRVATASTTATVSTTLRREDAQ